MSSQMDVDYESEASSKVKRAKANFEGLDGDCGNCQNHGKSEEEEFTRIFEQVFSIPLVLKKMLKNLEIADLLKTSLVDKNWNFFSREVIRQNKKYIAIIKAEKSCHDFQNLNALLLNCETVPFNGISIPNTWVGRKHRCILNLNILKLFSNVLNKINIKYLSTICCQDPSCSCSVFIREIFEQYACLLEELRFEDIPCETSIYDYFGLHMTGQWLPNIRVLQFPFILYAKDLRKEFIQDLVEASPKLEELHGSINANCLEFILSLNLTQAVKDFHFETKIQVIKNCGTSLENFSLEKPKLNKLSFSTCGMERSGETFCDWRVRAYQTDVVRIMKQILESSKESLKKVAFDHWDIILMTTRWNIPILQNVTHLSLLYNYAINDVESRDLVENPTFFEKIEWAKYFPNLKDVSVKSGLIMYLDRNFYLSNAFQQSNCQYVCESVRIFRASGSLLNHYRHGIGAHLNSMFKHTFPNVKEFHLKEFRHFANNLNELWTAWKDLETIHVWVDIRPVNSMRARAKSSRGIYDSAFLGIMEEEASYLLENVEQLESLEIVPTKPSIFNLRKLTKLEIHFFHLDNPRCVRRSNPTEPKFLTRLTGQCVFSRLPGLSVKIHRHLCHAKDKCYMAFNHLKPFVQFVESKNVSLHDSF